MAVKRNGLGKGLDSLIPTKAENNIKKEKSVSAEEKKAENYGEINVANSREKILMKLHF